MSNDKLAEALRDAEATVLAFLGDVAFDGSVCGIKQAIVKGMFARLQAHAAEAAQIGADPALSVGGCESVDRNKQMQAAEPVYQVDLGDGYNDVDEALFREYERFNKNHPNYYDIRILYTHPQPAQDASKYQELLMAVEKKFPGESRHETALRYIRETELQSCEPKCDAAMAKESGR